MMENNIRYWAKLINENYEPNDNTENTENEDGLPIGDGNTTESRFREKFPDYYNYLVELGDIKRTLSYYERKAERYVDRRSAHSASSYANDAKLQKYEEKYDKLLSNNKRLSEEFRGIVNEIISKKFSEFGKAFAITIAKIGNQDDKLFVLVSNNGGKWITIDQNGSIPEGTGIFNSKDEAKKKITDIVQK